MLILSSSRRLITASRTRLVYCARNSIPSTWDRKVLQHEQRARYSPTVSSMISTSPYAISRTERVWVFLRRPRLPQCGQGKEFGAQKRFATRTRGSMASMPVSLQGCRHNSQEGTGWFFWQPQLAQRLKTPVAFSEKCPFFSLL